MINFLNLISPSSQQAEMGVSSLSVAVAALPTCSHSLSSNYFSLICFPCNLNSIRTSTKLKLLSISNLSSSSSSSIHCASTAFDGVEFNQDEDEPSNGALGSVSEAEDDNGALQIADAGRLYVGNLPFSMTSAQLTEIFAEAGRVVSAEVWFADWLIWILKNWWNWIVIFLSFVMWYCWHMIGLG